MDSIPGSNPGDMGSSPVRPAKPSLEDFGIVYLKMVLGWDWDKVSNYTKQGCQELKPIYERTLRYVMGL